MERCARSVKMQRESQPRRGGESSGETAIALTRLKSSLFGDVGEEVARQRCEDLQQTDERLSGQRPAVAIFLPKGNDGTRGFAADSRLPGTDQTLDRKWEEEVWSQQKLSSGINVNREPDKEDKVQSVLQSLHRIMGNISYVYMY